MKMLQNKCSVCLIVNKNLRSTFETDENNVILLIKLQTCVPEVEWKKDYLLCARCLDLLQQAYKFHQLCIKSEESRKAEQSQINDLELKTDTFRNKSAEEGDNDDNKDEEFDLEKSNLDSFFDVKDESDGGSSSSAKVGSSKPKRKTKTKTRKEREPRTKVTDSTVCSECGATFINKYILKRHLKNVHASEKKYQCDLCSRTFASPIYLTTHKSYHSRDRSHICSFCGKGFITKSDLYHHEKIHANKRSYQCGKCSKAFNTSSDLHKHNMCVHTDRSLWKYECEQCKRRFPLKSSLDTHLKRHTGEKNFACHLCDRRCINKSVLTRHLKTHTNVCAFKCHVCQQSYKHKKSLEVHLSKCHGIGDVVPKEQVKKFFCHVCPKSYFDNNKLQKHIRSHTGEKPFKCNACEKSFTDFSYVKQHMIVFHGIVE